MPGAFRSPTTREELEAELWPALRERAAAIAQSLERQGARRVASYGSGAGYLEHLLCKRGFQVVATEYAPGTVERLRGALPDAEVVHHDLLTHPPIDADLHLFHRIDTELTDKQWRGVFGRFSGLPVMVAAAEVLSGHDLPHKLLLAWRNRKGTRAGWLRNRASFERLWAETHGAEAVTLGDLRGWLLR
jgi:hypothetical protein